MKKILMVVLMVVAVASVVSAEQYEGELVTIMDCIEDTAQITVEGYPGLQEIDSYVVIPCSDGIDAISIGDDDVSVKIPFPAKGSSFGMDLRKPIVPPLTVYIEPFGEGKKASVLWLKKKQIMWLLSRVPSG